MNETAADLACFLEATRRDVDAALDAWLPTPERGGDLARAMRHITLSDGKRLRPALVVLGCLDVGGAAEDALAAAAAVELLHAYSLVHDDLPCMDDARLRRGRPCVHVIHGEAMGVLAGDALLTMAFEVIGRHTPGAFSRSPTNSVGRVRLAGETQADPFSARTTPAAEYAAASPSVSPAPASRPRRAGSTARPTASPTPPPAPDAPRPAPTPADSRATSPSRASSSPP